jgi:hypothetical protein
MSDIFVRGLAAGRSLLLATALLVASTAGAGKVLSPAEAEATCSYWADVYAQISHLRGAGVTREALLARLDEVVREGGMPQDLKASYVDAVRFVFERARMDPETTYRGIYAVCYKQNTSVSAAAGRLRGVGREMGDIYKSARPYRKSEGGRYGATKSAEGRSAARSGGGYARGIVGG